MWQVEDVCISQPDGSRMMLFLGVTLGALCGLLLFACCAIACCFTRKSTLVQKLAVETSEGDDEKLRHSAESEAEPAEPQSYPWAARRWESTINLKDRAPLEWMSLEAASPSNWWPPTLPPQPAPPEAAQQSLSLIALDDMFAGAEPPTLRSLRRPPVPETLLQVDDDPSFRVWVQQVPAAGAPGAPAEDPFAFPGMIDVEGA